MYERRKQGASLLSRGMSSNSVGLLLLVLAARSYGKEHADIRGQSCDITFSSDRIRNGTVMSPGYPDPYPPNSACRFQFRGKGKERVQIFFKDFNLPHDNRNRQNCEGIDALDAYVSSKDRLEKIDCFCGSYIPKPLMSNGPFLLLEFKGLQSSNHARGFKAQFSFTKNFGVRGAGRQLTDYPCAFAFRANETSAGFLTSPNFPGLYPRNSECHYFFFGGVHQKVHLRFHYFDVEGVPPCEATSASDYVEFSNFMTRDRKYSKYCGELKEFTIDSDRKFFRVTFHSNDRLDGTGFNCTYQFLDIKESTQAKPTHNSFPEGEDDS